MIARYLNDAKTGKTAPPDLAETGRALFRESVREGTEIVRDTKTSATNEERRAVEHVPLHHVYYGHDLGDEYKRKCEADVARCLENFEKSDIRADLLDGTRHFGMITKLRKTVPHFDLDGTKIYANLDFAYREGTRYVILDWKTRTRSSYSRAKAGAQLSVYGVIRAGKRKREREISVRSVWLAMGECEEAVIDDVSLLETKRHIRDEIARTRVSRTTRIFQWSA